jgi:hypothetical protein
VLGAFLQEITSDPKIAPKFASANVRVLIHHTDPDSTILLDCTTNPPNVEFDPPDGTEAEVQLHMSADDGHKFWQGNLNVATAMAKRQVKIKGQMGKMMKLLPAVQPAFPRYAAFLEANGYEV